MTGTRILRRMAMLTALLFAATACSSLATAPKPAAGSLASRVDLRGVHITVGSKNYAEQRILGAIYVTALRAAGATVTDRTGIGGTMLAYAALASDQIDVYSEYTGTAWATIYGQSTVVTDAQALFTRVNARARPTGMSWFALSPANSTYAIAAPAKVLDEHGIRTLSDYAKLARTDPGAARLCSSSEFTTRDDGLPAVEAKYGFQLPRSQVLIQESSISVATMAKQHQCAFTSAVTTDPRVTANGLRTLVDDRKVFPTYNPAILMRSDKYAANRTAYDTLFGTIDRRITQDTLTELNRRVQIDNVPEAKVAEDFLSAHHLI